MAEMAGASEERWQVNINKALERNKHMFNNPVMSDIKFAFPNKQTIPAHKYVLATNSPVFFAMFYGDLAEKRETLDITDCDRDVFLQFLCYLYCEHADFQEVDSAIQVLYLADKYDVPSLAKKCVNFLDKSMEPLSAFDIILHARRCNCQHLEKVCWAIIDYNAKEIVTDVSFLELKPEFLLPLLERSTLLIDEVTLFKAVDRWAAKRCEEANMPVNGANKRSVLGEDLLKSIRFPRMSPKEFSDVAMPTEILFTTEVIDVFKQFTSVPVPGGFQFSAGPRMAYDATFHSCSMGIPACPWDGKCSYNCCVGEKRNGVLTFTVNKAITLCGVKIITDKAERQPSCRVSLTVALRGKMIRQIRNKYFTNKGPTGYHANGEIDVFFNRPFRLTENACYNIKAETDTTENVYVWSNQSTIDAAKSSILSGRCSGLYTECIPAHKHYKGEIMKLFYKE